jgi:hypothetical protein
MRQRCVHGLEQQLRAAIRSIRYSVRSIGPAGWIARNAIHDLRTFRDKAVEELLTVEREIGVPSEALKLANLTEQRLGPQHDKPE